MAEKSMQVIRCGYKKIYLEHLIFYQIKPGLIVEGLIMSHHSIVIPRLRPGNPVFPDSL